VQSQPYVDWDLNSPPAPGKYPDGGTWFKKSMALVLREQFDDHHVPQNVQTDLANCAWDMALGHLTPQQVADFNGFARGEHTLATPTRLAFEHFFEVPRYRGDYTAFEPYCPEKIAEFVSYFP
jgi:hypothetical protein